MIAVFLSCVAFGVFLLWVTHRNKGKPLLDDEDAPVYSKSLPLIGITHLVINPKKLFEIVKAVAQDSFKEGGVLRTTVALQTHYIITDPEEAIKVASECLERHYVYKFTDNFFGQSLFGTPAAVWKVHRKLLNPAFSLPMIHGFVECFNDQAKLLVNELSAFEGKGPFKATQYIHENVLKGTYLTTVGDNNKNDKDTIEQYTAALNKLSAMCVARFQNILQHSDLIYKLSGQKKIDDKLIEKLSDLSEKIIKKAKMDLSMANQENSKGSGCDRQVGVTTFLDKYLELNANNTLSDREFREELYFLIAAALETTSYTFEYVLNILGTCPEIQKRVFEEIINVIGKEKDVEKEDLQNFVYIDAVIKETLRLYPAIPVIARTVDHNVKLKNCTLREGSYAVIGVYGINRHPSWGPDAEQFRPERWLESGGVPNINIASAFSSFGLGKRNCIGKTYAMTSLKILIAHFVRKYVVVEADHTKMQFKWDVLMKPVNGNEISIRWRNI